MKKGCLITLQIFFGLIILYFIVNICVYIFYFNFENGKRVIKEPLQQSEVNFYKKIKENDLINIDSVSRNIVRTDKKWRYYITIYYYIEYNNNCTTDSMSNRYLDEIAYSTAIFIKNYMELKKYNFSDINVNFRSNYHDRGAEDIASYNFSEDTYKKENF